jgi:hypothetical protein
MQQLPSVVGSHDYSETSDDQLQARNKIDQTTVKTLPRKQQTIMFMTNFNYPRLE